MKWYISSFWFLIVTGFCFVFYYVLEYYNCYNSRMISAVIFVLYIGAGDLKPYFPHTNLIVCYWSRRGMGKGRGRRRVLMRSWWAKVTVHFVGQGSGLDADQVKRMLMSVLTLKSSSLMTVVVTPGLVLVQGQTEQSPLHLPAWRPVFLRVDVDLKMRF